MQNLSLKKRVNLIVISKIYLDDDEGSEDGSKYSEEMEALQMAILASQAETYASANTTYDKAGGKRHLPELGELPYVDETPSFEEVIGM